LLLHHHHGLALEAILVHVHAHLRALLAPADHDLPDDRVLARKITGEVYVQPLPHPQRTHPPAPLLTHLLQRDLLQREHQLRLAMRRFVTP